MDLYWDCSNCGCSIPGIIVYVCNNPNCKEICCGRCNHGDMKCGCSWEEGDDDNGYDTYYGSFCCTGKICSQSEWDTKIEEEEDEEKRRISQEKERKRKEVEQQQLYLKEVRDLRACFIIVLRNGLQYKGGVTFYFDDDVWWETLHLPLRYVTKIEIRHPCQCGPSCPEHIAGGKFWIEDDAVPGLIKWWIEKNGIWPFCSYSTKTNFWGKFDLYVFESKKKITINVDDLVSLTSYTPSIDEVLGTHLELLKLYKMLGKK